MSKIIDSSQFSHDVSPQNVVSVGPELAASAKRFNLAPGLYAVTIGDGGAHRCAAEGLALPITHLQVLGAETTGTDIFATGGAPGWAGPQGGTIVVRILPPEGRILLTTYRPANSAPIPLSIQVAPLGQPATLGETQNGSGGSEFGPEAQVAHPERAPRTRMTLAYRDDGESSVEGDVWAGTPGQGRLIEAFAIKPLDAIKACDIEYKAFGPNGIETPWVRDARLCGSRGRGISLTGFAIRLSAALNERFDVVYRGSFTGSGETGDHRNGEACLGLRADDFLEGMLFRIESRQ